jgi:PAS domain S-box-containing protein
MANIIKTIKIHGKTLLTIILGVAILVGTISLISWVLVMGGFSQLEARFVQRNISRSQEVIQDRLNNLTVKLSDWANWDDTYAFVEDKNEAYIKSNLTGNALELLKIGRMIFFNARGELVYTISYAPETGVNFLLPQGLRQQLIQGSVLLTHANEQSTVTGIMMLPEGPMLVASKPIVHSDGKGPIRGTVIFTTPLNSAEMQLLGNIIRSAMQARKLDSVLPPDFAAARKVFLEGKETFIKAVDAKTIAGYSVLTDIFGRQALILKVTMPRDITQFGSRTMAYFFVALIVVGFIFGAVVYVPLELEIIGRGRAEVALRESEEKYRGLFLNSRDAIMILQPPSWKFISGNPATLEMFRVKSEEEFMSLGPWDLSPELQPDGSASAQKAKEMIEAVMFEGFRLFEWTHKRLDGEAFPATVLLTRVGQGQGTALLATVRDITRQKQAEEEVRLKVAELERFNKIAVGRELRMIELKEKLKFLEEGKGPA